MAVFLALLERCASHGHALGEECGGCLQRLGEAAALYRGAFLQGFTIGDSDPFEAWVTTRREQLHRLALDALQRLAVAHERRGEVERGLPYAWRQVELDPWREEAQRQLMRLLALGGQRSAALAQYDACRQALAEELGAEPAAETTALYEADPQGTVDRSDDRTTSGEDSFVVPPSGGSSRLDDSRALALRTTHHLAFPHHRVSPSPSPLALPLWRGSKSWSTSTRWLGEALHGHGRVGLRRGGAGQRQDGAAARVRSPSHGGSP